jgi:hypothetical protein
MKILVVYHWSHKYGYGFGNTDATVSNDVLSIEDIREIERQICEANSFAKVVVLNIVELGKSEDSQ